ncbi:hypothetical protein [Staphylococcus delphini]|uniref:Phage PVL protein n=1 Tax=Staphylococcus delphini TaxID=53344 RepID=A0AAQ0D5G7_9STAP|nr:hypothetical protein [Staphylococcus delphini]QUM66193.1 hypothetical protein IPU21_08615 [Staphylococcus delphini]QUM67870.1 hypothetical protein IPU21_05275 [Staphylococcus delphini]QUM68628.1 hypothetical protein IPU22_08565 [Staphylococcus delphini]QUM70314.1 hypothetical protein IPU22_05230 [Staphylococcus delphini]
MKIKVEKKMNLHELIKWVWENEVEHEIFIGNKNGRVVFVREQQLNADSVRPDETFTVEVEEEITEDTKIPTLIELFVSGYGQIIHAYYRTSIREAIGEVVKGVDTLPKAFYILNDDMTMTLIWKDGELV